MASLLRSSKFVRYFAGFARNIVFNTKREIDGNFVQHSQCLCSNLTQGLSTAASSLGSDASLEKSLRKIDQDVRRSGRISRRDIEEILEELRNARSATSSQSLLVIRCCGNLVPEELPEIRTQLVQEIWRTLNNLKIQMDVSHYNALLRVYLENEHQFSPTEFLADMEAKGIEPNRVTYQRLIARYCQQGDIEGATHILEFMRAKQLPVNENVFNALIMGHLQAGDMESAIGILSVMGQAGLEPSADTYTTLLCGYASKGDLNAIESTLDTCESKEVYLLDKDYMDVLYSLVTNGYEQHADAIISRMRKSAGYNQDAVNLILRLVNKGYEDTALKVLKTMPRSSKSDGQLNIIGAFFIKQLVKAKRPIEKIMAICKELESEGLHPRAVSLAVEFGIQYGDIETAIPLLKELQDSGLPIRPHYFWPLICTQGKNKNKEGVLDVIRQMFTLGVYPNNETIRDYVIDNLQVKNNDEIVNLLRNAGVSLNIVSNSLVVHLLSQHKIKEAAQVATKYKTRHNPNLVRRHLMNALYASEDVESYVTIVRQVFDNLDRIEQQKPDDQDPEAPNDVNKLEVIGQFVLDVVQQRKRSKRIVLDVLQGLYDQGLGMTNEYANTIQERLGEDLTPEISTLLSKMTSGELELVDLKQTRYVATELDQSQLENLIATVEARGENPRGLKRQLLTAYCRNKNLEKAEDLIKKLETEEFSFNVGAYSQIIELYVNHGNLDKALHYLNKLNETEPGSSMDDMKVIKLISLMVENDKFDDALKLLEGQSRERKLEENSYNYSSTCWRFLNSLAEKGNAECVKKMFDTLLKTRYIEPSNILLGPLVKVHLVNNDLQSAMAQFEECCIQYRMTPWKNELASKLIQAEDVASLQKLTDLSTTIHGEVNSLYDLVFAFVECGRVRQARKILETPGLRTRPQRLNFACERYSQEGLTKPLEGLVEATKDLNHINRTDIYYNLLLSYCKAEDTDKALGLWIKLQEEDVVPTDAFLNKLGTYLQSKNLDVPFVIPPPTQVTKTPSKSQSQFKPPGPETTTTVSEPIQGFRKSLKNGDVDTALQYRKKLTDEKLGIFDESLLIEALVIAGRLDEAKNLVESMLANNVHPLPRIFKFYLNRLAAAGDVQTIENFGKQLSPDKKKLVSFDNRLCHANLCAGKVEEYLKKLENIIDNAKDNELAEIAEQFPRGGAVGVLEKHPEVMTQFEAMADKYASRGILSPINVLWMHQFVAGNKDACDRLWDKYLANTPRIMFQHILHAARKTNDEIIAQRLLDQLKKTKISEGAMGNAYSCLIDVFIAKEKFEEGLDCLKKALNDVCLENINRTALFRLKEGIEKSGKVFPFTVPDKNAKSSSSSSDDEKVRSKQ